MIVTLEKGSILWRCQSPYHHRWQTCHLLVSPFLLQHFTRFPLLRRPHIVNVPFWVVWWASAHHRSPCSWLLLTCPCAEKFRICINWVATRAWISKTTNTGNQSMGRSAQLSVREYTCVVKWRWRTVFTRNAAQEVAKGIEELRRRCYKKNGVTLPKLNEYSMQHDQGLKQGVYCGIKFEKYKNGWSLLNIRKSSKILSHRAFLAVPTFHIKLSFPRVPKSLAANPDCSEIHERMWVFPETFLIVNLHNECLKNYILIREIWQPHRDSEKRRNWEKWEWRTIATNTFTLLFGKSKGKKSRRQKLSYVYDKPCRGYRDLYSKWHDNSGVILPRRCIRGIVNIRTEVCSKAKIPHALCSGSRKSKQPIAGGLITPNSIRERFPDDKELNLMMASALKVLR